MNKQLKSWAWSIAIVLLYFYATRGVVKLLWNTSNVHMFEGRVKFIMYLLFFFSLVYIVGIYHLVGSHNVDPFYKVFIGFHVIYLITGSFYNSLSKE